MDQQVFEKLRLVMTAVKLNCPANLAESINETLAEVCTDVNALQEQNRSLMADLAQRKDVKAPTPVLNLTDEHIKEVALATGFKLKEQPDGEMDLNPYVYHFARALAGPHIKGYAAQLNLIRTVFKSWFPNGAPIATDNFVMVHMDQYNELVRTLNESDRQAYHEMMALELSELALDAACSIEGEAGSRTEGYLLYAAEEHEKQAKEYSRAN